MFYDQTIARTKQAFADQFETNNNGFIYRKSMKGPPTRVDSAERDAFIEQYARRYRNSLWLLTVSGSAFAIMFAVVGIALDKSFRQFEFCAGIAGILAAYFVWHLWAWNEPTRQLEGRTPMGNALGADEVRALNFSRLSYRQIGLVAMGAAALVFKESLRHDIWHGAGMFWPIFAAATAIITAVQAFRKWRFERAAMPPGMKPDSTDRR